MKCYDEGIKKMNVILFEKVNIFYTPPVGGYGISAYTHFHRALPYAIDYKAFSLTFNHAN